MKCYNHHGIDAVGVCVACGKALCIECAVDKNGSGITCTGNCENQIKRQNPARTKESWFAVIIRGLISIIQNLKPRHIMFIGSALCLLGMAYEYLLGFFGALIFFYGLVIFIYRHFTSRVRNGVV